MTGTVFRIARFSVHDGPGIRTTVFFKGCPLRCWWCHSPESQAVGRELALRADRCLSCGTCLPHCPRNAIERADDTLTTNRDLCEVCGTCVRVCPTGARELVGRTLTADELLTEIEKDVVFFDESGGGVTFSGGEPLLQAAFLTEALALTKARRIHTAIDTCGLADRDALLAAARLTDLFLFDLKVIDDGRHIEVTGASNRRILSNLRDLAAVHRDVRIRFPLVPGITDEAANVRAIGTLMRECGLSRVHVLPYHRAGIAKYDRLGDEYRLTATPAPSPEAVEDAVAALRAFGLTVQVGG